MKKHYLFIFLFQLSLTSYGQDIEITQIHLKEGKIEVGYNLVDDRIDRAYTINLYTSKDNFIQPMNSVAGDIGVDIKVGENKVLVWDAKAELGDDYIGKVSLELKGNYYVPFVTLEGISKSSEFKRGTKQDLVWSGGRGDNILQIELYREGNLVKSYEERPNNGQTVIAIPKGIPPGENYQFKVSDKDNRDEVVFSETFKIKRKYPLSYQIIAGVVGTVGVVFMVDALIPEPIFVIGEPSTPDR
ncbi:MAG: hypothetical protein ACI9XJ_001881 [Marivirga sp.]